MPQKKKRSRAPLGKLLLFVCAPLLIWLVAFILWFNWSDLASVFNKADIPPKSGRPDRPAEKSRAAKSNVDQPPREDIGEADRRKLEEVLKSK